MLNACGIASWRPQNHCILMLISLIPWPWSLFNQTHYVCGRQGYGAQRCPVLVQNMLPYMAKELFKWDSGTRTSDGGRFSTGCHLITWALKQRIFSRHRSVREMWWKRGGVNVRWRAVGGLWSWRRGHDSRNAGGLWPVEWAPAGSQQWYRNLSPPAAKEWILTTSC